MKVLIEIEGDNAAFGENLDEAAFEVARILREASGKILSRGLDYPGTLPLHDINGNTVGHVTVED